MPEVQCETWHFVTTELAILWCFASVKSHPTPRALNSSVTDWTLSMSQNMMTMAGMSFWLSPPFSIFCHNIFTFHQQHGALENVELSSIYYIISTNMWRECRHNYHNNPI